MLRPNSPRPSSLAKLRRRKRRRRKRLRQVQHQHPAHRKNRRHNKPRLVERRCPDGPATSCRRWSGRRAPTPNWIGGGFIVLDANGQALAYIYFEEEPGPEPPNDGARGRGGVEQSAASSRLF